MTKHKQLPTPDDIIEKIAKDLSAVIFKRVVRPGELEGKMPKDYYRVRDKALRKSKPDEEIKRILIMVLKNFEESS